MKPVLEAPASFASAEQFQLLLRIFAKAADAGQATAQTAALLSALVAYAPHVLEPPTPYWKMPELYEHFLQLAPAHPATFEAVIALAGGNWWVMRDSECEAVWNTTPGHVFLLPEVSWVEVKLILQTPQSDQTG